MDLAKGTSSGWKKSKTDLPRTCSDGHPRISLMDSEAKRMVQSGVRSGINHISQGLRYLP